MLTCNVSILGLSIPSLEIKEKTVETTRSVPPPVSANILSRFYFSSISGLSFNRLIQNNAQTVQDSSLLRDRL